MDTSYGTVRVVIGIVHENCVLTVVLELRGFCKADVADYLFALHRIAPEEKLEEHYCERILIGLDIRLSYASYDLGRHVARLTADAEVASVRSDVITYRVYDYGRLGADGKPRELHIEKALDVTNTVPAEPKSPVYGMKLDGVVTQLLADCEYFNVNRHRIIKELELYADKSSFAHVLMIGGSGGELVADNYTLPLTMGSSVYVPAGTGAFAIKGNCDIIVTTIQ